MLSIAVVPMVGDEFSLQVRHSNYILWYWRVDIKDVGDRVDELMQEWSLVKSHFSTHHGNLKHEDCPICKEEK